MWKFCKWKKRKNYPKCVPIAKAASDVKNQRAGAVARKQAVAKVLDLNHQSSNICSEEKESYDGWIYGQKNGS